MCILLAFISRSGSTLLARYLDAIPTVGVTLEANLPDGIFRPELVIEHPKAIDRALDTLFDDAKFRAWSIAPEAVRARMLEHSFPLRFATLLPDILKPTFAIETSHGRCSSRRIAFGVSRRRGACIRSHRSSS